MDFQFIDAHTHIQFSVYDEDRNNVVNRAFLNGVKFINAGTNKETSLKAVDLTEKYDDGVYATIGLHPSHTADSQIDQSEIANNKDNEIILAEKFDKDFYYSLGDNRKVIGIGECGLDFFHLENGNRDFLIEKQKSVFIEHIKLAKELEKPLVIHCREAFPDLIKILNDNKKILLKEPGIIHFFTGTKDNAKNLLDLGFSFTFGGAITFPPKKNLQNIYEDAIKFIPIDKILSETDAPYLAPIPYRGKRNEPAYVVETVKKIAEFKNISFEKMSKIILETAYKVFGI